ncbi:fibronectin type III domain-containing protein [Vallitalea guaymasensis]|uniref:fibronectin type III domain-containing protein n=1 Tax=Vallitalea guaymasensis TaxID=1185412 RepID=UPI000DE3EEBB|nr:fibronectin type III domain-containing protein [Vallitalea guaymasensis]
MIIVLSGGNVYAATVGDVLTQPEDGWKRFDDTDSKYIYQGDFLTEATNECYNASAHWLKYNPVEADTSIRFKFYGSKLRIIGNIHNEYTKSLIVNVDGTTYTVSAYNIETVYQSLICEITNLTNKTHYVEIYSSDNLRYAFDAIDIDDTGELLQYITQPSQLRAFQSNDKINLNWDVADGADSYIILRSTTSDSIDKVIATNVTETTYIDNDVESGVTYYYVVRAVKNGVESPYSNVASATIEEVNPAVIQIKLSTTDVYEYRVTNNEVDNFMNWYIDRSNGIGLPFYNFSTDSIIEPYTHSNEYLIFDKIVWFKVKEYINN